MIRNSAIRLMMIACAIAPDTAHAQIAVSIRIGPPVLPVYTQPPCPVAGYLWTPGYWAYGAAGYYWVPGVWVAPPRVGLLWTPGYWGLIGGVYGWHAGYWGPHVGFYGGVNYGFGYAGVGFAGGAWAGGAFRYNTAVVNVNTAVVRNVYVDRTVINNTAAISHASFNGPGGMVAQPTPQEQAFAREPHIQPTAGQISHQQMASQDHSLLASENHGRPGTPAMDSINGRRFNQQGRIASGLQSGRLSAGQAANLEHREANVNREIRSDRQANGGTLTPQERQKVNQQQNNLNKSIYKDKHSGPNGHPNARPQNGGQREEKK